MSVTLSGFMHVWSMLDNCCNLYSESLIFEHVWSVVETIPSFHVVPAQHVESRRNQICLQQALYSKVDEAVDG